MSFAKPSTPATPDGEKRSRAHKSISGKSGNEKRPSIAGGGNISNPSQKRASSIHLGTNGIRNASPVSNVGGGDKYGYFQEQIEQLQRQGDSFAKKIEIEKRKKMELAVNIKRLRGILYDTKKKIGGASTANDDLVSAAKNIRTLENRVEKVLTKLNETCNLNKNLREKIQNLRREKVQQQQIREKLERELHVKNTEAMEAIQLTQAAYDGRDRAHRNAESIRLEIIEESNNFDKLWNDKKDALERSRAAVKDHPKNRVASRADCQQQNENLLQNDLLRSQKLKQDNSIAHWSIAKKEVDLKKQSERVQYHEDALNKIRTETKVDNIDEIINGFISSEETNFSLFNMINSLNTEMEDLEVTNHTVRQCIESYKGTGQSSDEQRKMIKKSLEDQIDKTTQKVTFYQNRYNESVTAIDSMKSGIMGIFHKVGSPDEALGQHLISTGITDINIMKLLGIVEQRIGEIVQMHNMSTADSDEPERYKDKIMSTKPKIHSIIHAQLPNTDEFAESDGEENDESLKPYSIQELHEKTSVAVKRRKEKVKPKR